MIKARCFQSSTLAGSVWLGLTACSLDWPPPLVQKSCKPQSSLAFPTAEGFGAQSIGGRGGKIVRVSNTQDTGEGSFRAALMMAESRIIVFDVSGDIELTSPIRLTAIHSNVTIAGQTSPGGVQLKGPGTFLSFEDGFHDGIVRHLRVRPGGRKEVDGYGLAIRLLGEPEPIRNVVIDHCDLNWGGSAMAANLGQVENTTWQWNAIAEGIKQEDGTKSSSLGIRVEGYDSGEAANAITISFHHNLLSQNAGDNPSIGGCGIFDFRNNVIFNWRGNNAAVFGESKTDNRSAFGNFVGNIYLPGNSSLPQSFFIRNGSSLPDRDRGGTRIFIDDNWGPLCTSGCPDDWDHRIQSWDAPGAASEAEFRATEPFAVPEVFTHPTAELKKIVLAKVGATPLSRDALSQRIVDEVAVIPTPPDDTFRAQAGPWPELTGGSPPTDTDADGMPDDWEKLRQLDPSDPSDGPQVACNGWTNVENYLNELAGDAIEY